MFEKQTAEQTNKKTRTNDERKCIVMEASVVV
jgi:hypothetical protein